MQPASYDGLRELLVAKSVDMDVSEIIATATGTVPEATSVACRAYCNDDNSVNVTTNVPDKHIPQSLTSSNMPFSTVKSRPTPCTPRRPLPSKPGVPTELRLDCFQKGNSLGRVPVISPENRLNTLVIICNNIKIATSTLSTSISLDPHGT